MLEPSALQSSSAMPAELRGFSLEYVSSWQEPTQCCSKTIRELAPFNAMMVCSVCHSWIKVFDDPKSFRKFLEFSNTRARRVYAHESQGRYFAVYKIYAPASSSASSVSSKRS